jgi:hypothetical protein
MLNSENIIFRMLNSENIIFRMLNSEANSCTQVKTHIHTGVPLYTRISLHAYRVHTRIAYTHTGLMHTRVYTRQGLGFRA